MIYMNALHKINISFEINFVFLQRKYLLKFATDGAVLTKTKNAVQGTMKLIPCDDNSIVLDNYDYTDLEKEITL